MQKARGYDQQRSAMIHNDQQRSAMIQNDQQRSAMISHLKPIWLKNGMPVYFKIR
jgi:hypothetical protein